jgi:predicted 3-demethylubiquinone-9 3-methyltransferase (glyoxalase superfamily)
MQKITPFLWFDNNAEEAVNYYTSIFKDSKITNMSRYSEAGPGPAGSVMVANFTLNGQEFMAINGGPMYKFTEAVSFVVNCEDQKEIDHYWEKLTAGGSEVQCGWLKDKFGLSWQVVPTAIGKLMSGDPIRSGRVAMALYKMIKIDIAQLQKAYDGE